MFLLFSTDDGNVPAWDHLPCEAITPKEGLCLAFDATSGQLQVSTIPEYICMREEAAAVAAGTIIPVVRIQKNQVWESALDAANTSLKNGSTVDVETNGLLIDADGSTNDNFQIVYLEDTAINSVVRGRFVK